MWSHAIAVERAVREKARSHLEVSDPPPSCPQKIEGGERQLELRKRDEMEAMQTL